MDTLRPTAEALEYDLEIAHCEMCSAAESHGGWYSLEIYGANPLPLTFEEGRSVHGSSGTVRLVCSSPEPFTGHAFCSFRCLQAYVTDLATVVEEGEGTQP